MATTPRCRNCSNLQGLVVRGEGDVRGLAHRLHRARDTDKVLAQIAATKADIAEYRSHIEACACTRTLVAS